ncbi:MAG: LTA synthase family protein [Sedimentisphaerales bacterium]|nr:LTA synthase family protein [Sedimentisphaerales bacterium]
MNLSSIKNAIKIKRDKFNREVFDYATARPYTVILALALLCTLVTKLFYAIRRSQVEQYPGWILADIAFLLGVEVILVFICFRHSSKWTIRTATILAAIMCLWSFLNAGWLIRTGTQILPRVLLTVVRDPVNAFHMIGKNLSKVPVTAVLLLLPGAIALTFFFYVLAKPRIPNYNRKRFFIRFVVCIVVCLTAIAIRPVLLRSKPSKSALLELQYNAQLKAITSLVFNHHRPPPEPTRRVPFYDQLKVASGPQMRKDNIVVIVLEGVQYEQSSLGGNSMDLTPYIANLAKQGASFTNARSTLTHTTKALFTLLTGRFASASQDIVEAVPVSKAYAGLPTILRDQLGYKTAFFQSARGNFECRPGLVYNLGFDKFWARDDLNDPNQFVGYLGCDEYAMIKPIKSWIKSDNRPFLLTIMCSVTHDPYEAPEWFGEQAKEDIERYRQTIAYTDKFLAAFEQELTQLGIMENTIFCVIGDHGEAFNEHGRSGHERIAFDEALHVLFCLKSPIIEPETVITKPVSSIDLTPTLLSLLGFQTEKAGFDGVNILGKIRDERKVYFSGWMYESQAGYVQENFKYVYDPVHETACYYDLKKDPNEQEKIDVPEDKKEAISSEIESWRENTVFQYDQEYKGKRIIYNRWLCSWGNRDSRAKYVTIEDAREFAQKRR